MKQVFVAFLLGGLVVFSGCTKGCSTPVIGCAIEDTVVDAVAPLVSSQLQCSYPDLVHADLKQMIGGLNLCKQVAPNGKYNLPLPLCNMFADLVLNGVAKAAIPASWGCTAVNAKELLKGVILSGCSSI